MIRGGMKGLVRRVMRAPVETAQASAFLLAGGAIAINALFLQSGPHPAPIAASPRAMGQTAPSSTQDTDDDRVVVAMIQAELAARGFYEGPVDGLDGPLTRTAIEAYGRQAGLVDMPRDEERLLVHIRAAPLPELVSGRRTAARAAEQPASAPSAGDDRVRAVQAVLAKLGYAPGPVDGLMGEATSDAIRAFEIDRDLPETGEISQDLLDELEAVLGQPVI